MATFRKRVFTPVTFIISLSKAAVYSPVLIKALIKPSTSRALREKVMLSTTSVNDCRYCSWVHTNLALQNGVDLDELNQMLSGVTGDLNNDKDAVAVIFAQHFAEQQGKPEANLKGQLNAAFSGKQKREIMAYIHAIYFSNLSGNTFDALLARFKGDKVEYSQFWLEVVSSLISWPIFTAIMLSARKSKRAKLGVL